MRAFLAVALAGVLMTISPALAVAKLPPGVHIDPGSPTGKQYQIPISGARGQTSGGQGGSSNPPAFGVGVTPSASAGSTGGSAGASAPAGAVSSSTSSQATGHARSGRDHARIDTRGSTTHATTKTPVRTPGPATTQASQVGSSSGSWLPLAIGGALVLLVGCGGGLALKRRA